MTPSPNGAPRHLVPRRTRATARSARVPGSSTLFSLVVRCRQCGSWPVHGGACRDHSGLRVSRDWRLMETLDAGMVWRPWEACPPRRVSPQVDIRIDDQPVPCAREGAWPWPHLSVHGLARAVDPLMGAPLVLLDRAGTTRPRPRADAAAPGLQLARPFAGDAQRRADLFQGVRPVAVQTEAPRHTACIVGRVGTSPASCTVRPDSPATEGP